MSIMGLTSDTAASILVVDDNENNRDMLAVRIRRLGHQVTVADGGQRALKLIEEQAFDIVLLDTMMPEVDGLQVLGSVRRTHPASVLPIAKDGSEDVVQALELGANDYVTKPIDFPVLCARMTAQLARKQAEDALKKLNQNLEQRVQERTTETHELNKKLTYQSTHDPLTGLINRREFERRLQQLLDTTKVERSQHAICYLDLDQFKIINDTCGHVAGDQLLRQLATLLAMRFRKQDTLARMGGDEFGILLQHCTLTDAQRIATGLRDTIGEFSFIWEDKKFRVGASIGLVPITETSGELSAVLSLADTACYAAKDEGRHRIYVYRENDKELAKRHGEMSWVTRIHHALEEDLFLLFYQPIQQIMAVPDAGMHYEVLIRMQGEDGSIIPPGAFLPAAERYHISKKIDYWVVDRLFAWLHRQPQHLRSLSLCSINLSGQSLGDEEFLQFIISRFKETGLPPTKICFEITETAAINNLAHGTLFIKELKKLGCRFALDDFGTGLSSFAYLKTLPVDFLKIDGHFVKDIVGNPVDMAIVKSINTIGNEMGMQTIAEFVENDAILQILREIGVNFAQGYGIGHPRPIGELVDCSDRKRVLA